MRSDDDLLNQLEKMTPVEREQFAARVKEYNDSVMDGIRRGDLKCPTCGMSVLVHRDDMSWAADCRCGWNAAGVGHAPVH